ncbi:MFS transporter [Herbaspirillum sp. YR522]|uniref:MFS transporter n=1 Tax=Herbaspirillum sp. YR522 TaxID=1144342 RepID=UPI00026F5CE3|nr:MFS transporter [Herbaspirillum sp. YR522]EJM98644.1 arabinose efflux permease family protein [Herbaspirillum sp. YR522]
MIAARQLALLGLLCSIAPASVDIYLPAFGAIAADFALPPGAVHRTLGLYMLAYACMLPLHGGLADSCGRKPVVLVALGIYLAASLLCVVAPCFDLLLLGRVLQGAAAGACSVVAPAMLQDCRGDGRDGGRQDGAQRAMSILILILNLASAVAPIVGGYLTASLGWRANFAALAGLAALAWVLCLRQLRETLPHTARRPFRLRQLLHDYAGLAARPQVLALGLAGALPVAGQGLIIGGAPMLVVQVLGWQPTDFAYLFLPLVAGAMVGAALALRLGPRLALGTAYGCMGCAGAALVLGPPDAPLAMILALGTYIGGLAMATPPLTLRLLACVPGLCGSAASLSGVMQLLMFALASGWLAPRLAASPAWLGAALLAAAALSMLAWGASHRYAGRGA